MKSLKEISLLFNKVTLAKKAIRAAIAKRKNLSEELINKLSCDKKW